VFLHEYLDFRLEANEDTSKLQAATRLAFESSLEVKFEQGIFLATLVSTQETRENRQLRPKDPPFLFRCNLGSGDGVLT
jgi:hypothetical protein